jgi:hypothetical protein
MRFGEIYKLLKEGYKEAEKEFSTKSSNEEVKEVIQKFKELVNKNQVKGQERNIDYWRKQGWNKFMEFTNQKYSQPTMTQIKRKKQVGKSIILEENDKWLIVIPLDKDASCFHGKDTDWCVTKPFETHFERYFYGSNITLIYFIRKQDLEKWAISYELKTTSFGKTYAEAEYFDKEDNKIFDHTFEEETGLNPNNYIEKSYGKENLEIITKSRTDMKDMEEELAHAIENITPRKNDHDLENKLFKIKNPALTRRYVEKVGYTDNYTKPFMKMAVNMNGSSVLRFLNADDSIKKEAIKNLPDLIFHLDNVTPDMIRLGIFHEPDLIKNIDNPDKETQLVAVKKDGRMIQHIDNPDRDVQLEAVKSSKPTYTSNKITYDDDPEIMMAALNGANYSADKNLKYMLDNGFEVTKDMIETVMKTTLPANFTYIIPVIIRHKEKFNFDVMDIVTKIYKERMKEE